MTVVWWTDLLGGVELNYSDNATLRWSKVSSWGTGVEAIAGNHNPAHADWRDFLCYNRVARKIEMARSIWHGI
jgi:hypothetical protein